MTTLMACPDIQMVMSYVPVDIGDVLLNYNSKLPLVIYAPKDLKMSYRLWRADSEILTSKIE